VPATTEPGATTTTDVLDAELPSWADDSIPGWVLPEGGRFRLTGAMSYPTPQFGGGDPYDLWATDGATRTTGTWLYVASLQQQGDYLPLRGGASIVDLGGTLGLVTTGADGVTDVVVDRPNQIRFQVAAHGIELGRLLEIVREVEMFLNGPGYGDLVGADGGLDGMVRRVTQEANTGYGPLGLQPVAVTSYFDADRGEWVELSMAPRDDERLATADLLISQPIDEAGLSDDERSNLAVLRRLGLAAEVRRPVSDQSWPFDAVVWPSVDGTYVTVTGDASVATLLEVAVQAVRAAPRQWRTYVRETMNGVDIGPGVDDPSPTVIGSSTSGQWKAIVQDDTFSLYGPATYAYERFEPPSGPTLRVFRTLDDAFLLATNTWPNAGMRIVVDQPGSDVDPGDAIVGNEMLPVDTTAPTSDPTVDPTAGGDAEGGADRVVPLVQIGDTPVFGAVVRIDPLLPFTVRWLDGDGAPVDGPAR
jgi:hypothetical protein